LLTEELASALGGAALAGCERENPRANTRLLSAAHMLWLLARVLRLHPMLPENGRIAAVFDAHLSAANLEMARDELKRNPLFERPHGWAWLLDLQAEALRMQARWSRALAPLAGHVASEMEDFVALPEPIRSGAHANSAFACILALDYARAARDAPLEFAIVKAAKRWYGSDRAAPLAGEPSPGDFLSPSLVEAVLMKQLMEPMEFARWLNAFLPDGIGPLAEPPVAAEGLCLSRAWCFNGLGLPDPAAKHFAAAMPRVVAGDYAEEHRLASLAVLALSGAALKTP
jgi:hypothetical protein